MLRLRCRMDLPAASASPAERRNSHVDAETRESLRVGVGAVARRHPACSLAEAESVRAEVGMAFGRGQSTKWNPQGQTRLLVDTKAPRQANRSTHLEFWRPFPLS
jgi:hypothetical protein